MSATNLEITVASLVTAIWVLALWGWCRAGTVCPAETDPEVQATGPAEGTIRTMLGMASGGYARTAAILTLALVVMAGPVNALLGVAALGVAAAVHRIHVAVIPGSRPVAIVAEVAAALWAIILTWR